MESCSLPSLRRRLEEESEPETHMPRLDSGDQRTLCGGQLGTIPHLDSQSGTVDETGSNGTQLGNRIAVPPRSTIREPPAWAIRRSSLALFSAARHGDVSVLFCPMPFVRHVWLRYWPHVVPCDPSSHSQAIFSNCMMLPMDSSLHVRSQLNRCPRYIDEFNILFFMTGKDNPSPSAFRKASK